MYTDRVIHKDNSCFCFASLRVKDISGPLVTALIKKYKNDVSGRLHSRLKMSQIKLIILILTIQGLSTALSHLFSQRAMMDYKRTCKGRHLVDVHLQLIDN